MEGHCVFYSGCLVCLLYTLENQSNSTYTNTVAVFFWASIWDAGFVFMMFSEATNILLLSLLYISLFLLPLVGILLKNLQGKVWAPVTISNDVPGSGQ